MYFEFLIKLYNYFINRYYIMILIKRKKEKKESLTKKKNTRFLLDLLIKNSSVRLFNMFAYVWNIIYLK